LQQQERDARQRGGGGRDRHPTRESRGGVAPAGAQRGRLDVRTVADESLGRVEALDAVSAKQFLLVYDAVDGDWSPTRHSRSDPIGVRGRAPRRAATEVPQRGATEAPRRGAVAVAVARSALGGVQAFD